MRMAIVFIYGTLRFDVVRDVVVDRQQDNPSDDLQESANTNTRVAIGWLPSVAGETVNKDGKWHKKDTTTPLWRYENDED